jgi:hypothetical protein
MIIPPLRVVQFQNRSCGSFGVGAWASVAEWITFRWWRFNVAMLAIAISLLSILSPSTSVLLKLLLCLFSPIAALLYYPIIKIFVFVLSWIPLVKYFIAFARIAYLSAFSKLVVERAPQIILPYWF